MLTFAHKLQLALVVSFAPTFTSAPMDGPRARVLLFLKPPTTLATPFSSSMVMTGRVASLRSVPTASPTPRWALAAVVASVAVALLAGASVAVVDSEEVVAAGPLDTAAEEVDLAALLVQVVQLLVAASIPPLLPPSRPILSPTSRQLARRGVRQSTSET